MCIYCIYNSMSVCKWCMSGSATENSILLSVLPRLNKIFNQSINQSGAASHIHEHGLLASQHPHKSFTI